MISIITPSYNQAKYIERTIQSVLTQNVPHLEYVIIDGASTDETISILNNFRKNITFISEKDQGQAHAVNKGIQKTSNEIIGWLNSDDIYYPNALNQILEIFKNNPDVDIVYAKTDHIDHDDKIIASYPTEQWDLQRLKQTCFISQPGVFFKRKLVLKYGLLNQNLNFCLDYEYWLRLALDGIKFFYLPIKIAGSRLHQQTKTLSFPEEAHQETVKMLKNKLGYVPINWLIKDAIINIKEKSKINSKIYYVIQVILKTIILAFKQNGFFNGIKSCFNLPRAFLNYFKYKSF